MIVMKFGGTSVQDASAIRQVVGIIAERRSHQPVIVVSACAGVTNDLITLAESAVLEQHDTANRIVAALIRRHLTIADELLSGGEFIRRELNVSFVKLTQCLSGIAMLRELTPRSRDWILSFGEWWSALLITVALCDAGIDAQYVPPQQLICTNDRYGEAEPDLPATAAQIDRHLLPVLRLGHVPVTGGFVGATSDGITTTLGRGGSDYSASLIGSLIGADEIQIWTDVDGLRSADPRILHDARPHLVLSYREAERLAILGANILHPKTIRPAEEHGIPIRILNTRQPDDEGTLIGREENERLFCITHKSGLSLVSFDGHWPEWLASVLRDAEAVHIDPTGGQILLRADAGVPITNAKQTSHVAVSWVSMRQWRSSYLVHALHRLNEAGIVVHALFQRESSMGFATEDSDLFAAIRHLHDALEMEKSHDPLVAAGVSS